MLNIKRSQKVINQNIKEEPITLIYQYFIHKTPSRQKEITSCLEKCVKNSHISKIILLNEKIYSKSELGVDDNKIEQVNIKNRIRFSDIFDYVENNKVKGYIVTCNADIFFDDSLKNIYKSGLHKKKMVFAQLRFDYTNPKLGKCKLFGPRCDSQDTWIFHSNYNIPKSKRRIFKINYGIGGCDNKVAYLFDLLGYDVRNEPYFIKTFHYHKTEIRDYLNKARIKRPYTFVIPYLKPRNYSETYPLNMWAQRSGISWEAYTENERIFLIKNDITTFKNNLDRCFASKSHCIVPATNTELNRISYIFMQFIKLENNNPRYKMALQKVLHQASYLNSIGINIKTLQHLHIVVGKYLDVITRAPLSFHYSPGDRAFHGDEGKEQIYHRFILDEAKRRKRVPIHRNVLNIGDQMEWGSWVESIINKRILIISSHHKSIQAQINKSVDFYSKPLFKGCTFNCIDIPTPEKDKLFMDVINEYINKNRGVFNTCDIFLIGETPYDFLLTDFAGQLNKSAISAGHYLAIWFGLYSKEHSQKFKDIISVYMNKHWQVV